jgi:hypothetical protein
MKGVQHLMIQLILLGLRTAAADGTEAFEGTGACPCPGEVADFPLYRRLTGSGSVAAI